MIERLVLGIARHRHPWLNRVFGMSRELLARDDARERAALAQLEERWFGPDGVRGLDGRPLLQACRMSLASAAAKRTLQPPLTRWIRVFANFIGLGPLTIGLLLSSRERATPQKTATFCFVPADRYADEARRILGRQASVSADRGPRLTARVFGFLARCVGQEPSLLAYPELLTNALRWLAYYEHVLLTWSPEVIGNFAEGVSSMPLATLYARENGTRNVNLQHGERLVNRQVAFMLFDECHFWSDKYAQVYVDSKSLAERVWITGCGLHRQLASARAGWRGRPLRLLVLHHRIPTMPAGYEEGVVRLVRALGPNWEVAVRPHPQDGGLWEGIVSKLKSIGPDRRIIVEHARDVPLFDAATRARVVVGATSSAIIESWIGGSKVVLVPGMARKESALEPYGASPNVLWLDDAVTSEDLAAFLDADMLSDEAEWARIDRVTLVSSTVPVEWKGRPC